MQTDVTRPRVVSLPTAEYAPRAAALIEEEIRAAIAARGACRLAHHKVDRLVRAKSRSTDRERRYAC